MHRLRKTGGALLRFGIAAGILTFLLHKIGLAQAFDELRTTIGHWPWIIAAHMIMLTPLLATAWRWKLILHHVAMAMSWPRTLAIFFIGQFFNAFMIGATGGDVLKAFYTARETRQNRTEAITSIFIDRIVGLYAIIFIVAGIVLARLPYFLSNATLRPVAMFILASALVGAAFLLLIVRRNPLDRWPLLRRLSSHRRMGQLSHVLDRAYRAFQACHQQPVLFGKLILLSAANQLLAVLGWACVGHALGLNLSAWDYFCYSMLIGFIGTIPITPGGLGLREGASVHILAAIGVAPDKAFLLSFLPYLSSVIWGLPGGIVFLFYPATRRAQGDVPASVPPLSG